MLWIPARQSVAFLNSLVPESGHLSTKGQSCQRYNCLCGRPERALPSVSASSHRPRPGSEGTTPDGIFLQLWDAGPFETLVPYDSDTPLHRSDSSSLYIVCPFRLFLSGLECAGDFEHGSPEMPSDTSVNKKVRSGLPGQER